MFIKNLEKFIKKGLKLTSFWKNNSLVIREFKFFSRVAYLAIILTMVAAVFEGFGLGFLFAFLQSITEQDAAPIQTGIHWFDVGILGINAPITERIYRISALILLMTLLRTSFIYLGRVYSGLASSYLAYQLRLRLFEQLQAVTLNYFTKTRSGALVNSITSEIQKLMQAFEVMSILLIKSMSLLVYITSMLLLSWQLTLLTLMLFSLLSVGISALIKRVREISFAKTKASSGYTSIALEFINGVRTVQAYAAQNYESQRFQAANLNLLKAEKASCKYHFSVEPLTEGIATTILIGMLLSAFSILIPQGKLQVSALLTFLFILFRLMPIIRQINGARAKLSNFKGSIENIKELLRTDNKPYLTNGTLQFSGLKHQIEFRAVDFGYEAEHLVLHNITLSIQQGKMTALVGASGAGKTTLVDLIPRFYDPTRGEIRVDGVDLRDFEVNSLRRQLAVVSQDTFIFNTSVKENIAYAIIDEVDNQAIWEAARIANALEFIQELPDGFETQLGDRGVRLSGGQRQRIAIARALLRNPEILILDEATSALDSVSERLIQESLETLCVGRTVIAIAHRLSTIIRADKVVVLEQGRIVEEGGYQELLEQRGKLWKYHQMQHEFSPVSLGGN